MSVSFPNESAAYRESRNALLKAEVALRQKSEEVAGLRRNLPPGGTAEDYAFRSIAGDTVLLSSLFPKGQTTLAIYSLMYGPDAKAPCPMCSSFLHGMVGQIGSITQQMGFAVVAQSGPARLAELREKMGWRALPLYSAEGTCYQRDYHAEMPDGAQLPMMNIFVKDDEQVRHFWGSEMFFADSPWHPRHIDQMWPLWNLLDLTPGGRGDFIPSLHSI